MRKEIRISYKDFCKLAIERMVEMHSELLGAKVEYIKSYSYEPEGRYEEFYEKPDEVAFTIAEMKKSLV